jgi:hypothetical protein
MKTSLIVAGLVAIASAAPTWDDWKGKGDYKKFTSYYHVIATPEQVINGTRPTPGEPGAVGFYNFAIDSKSNTICYVSLPQATLLSHTDKSRTLPSSASRATINPQL